MINLGALVPTSLKRKYWQQLRARELRLRFGVTSNKHAEELAFWESRWNAEGGRLTNDQYLPRFLEIAQEETDNFCNSRILADFGCGPRGSLHHFKNPRLKIGIDVLANAYGRFGIQEHDMVYVCSTEDHIPLPSNYVDVLFTQNALDHVDNLEQQSQELLRILRPDGEIIGSFNLEEPASETEPQMLTEHLLDEVLLRHFTPISYRTAPKSKTYGNAYEYFHTAPPPNLPPGPRLLWYRGRRKNPG